MKVSTLRTPRSCQIPKHARLRTHDTSENPTSHARRILRCRTSTHYRRREIAGDAVSSPDLDSSPSLSIRTGTPHRSRGISVPDGVHRSSEGKTDLSGNSLFELRSPSQSKWNSFDIAF